MKLYAVFREAVYRHECGGIFSTQELAEASARQLACGEPDRHHRYDVVPFDLDVTGAQDPSGRIDEPETTYSVDSPLNKRGPGLWR